MSKKTFIHAENNNKILSSNEVKLYVPPEPEKMKIIIWGKELCNIAEWNDFLKCVEEKTRENDQLKQQLVEKDKEINSLIVDYEKRISQEQKLMSNMEHLLTEKQNAIDEINKEFVQAVHDWKTLCAEKDKEIEDWKQKTQTFLNRVNEQNYEIANNNPKQLAIQELEKVKNFVDGRTYCANYIKKRIKELKGEKDVED